MTEAFLSVLSYDWWAPLSHPSSCMLVNHGSLQHSCKEEYKPRKEGATARYYTSHTKTMLPMKSVPRSSKQSGPHKDLRCKLQWYGHVSHSSGLAQTILQGGVKGGGRQGRQRKRWEDNIRTGQTWNSASSRGQWRAEKNGGNWLRSHLWCPYNPCS